MKYWEVAIITIVIGYVGDAILGYFLNWSNAGLVCRGCRTLRHRGYGRVPAMGDRQKA